MSEPTRLGHPAVYVGRNQIIVNALTMCAIVRAWLQEHHSGGPYKVTAVTQSGTDGRYEITFEAVPTAEAKP